MKILFVCLGNICRSPSAEAVTKKLIAERSLPWLIDSAGTNGYHNGEPADSRTRQHGEMRGYSVDSLSRQIGAEDFASFDYIFGMDLQNIRTLKKICPHPHLLRKIHLITDFGSDIYPDGVPDPYYGKEEDFIRVIDILEDCCPNAIEAIVKKRI